MGDLPILWGRGSSTNVQKVLWALHELEIAHDRIEVGGPFGGIDSPDFTAMNPNRTVPVWQTDELVLWESQAILRHLARSHGRLYGQGEQAMAETDQWLDWFALVFWPPVRLLFLEVFRDKRLTLDDRLAQDALTKAKNAIQIVEERIEENGFLTGPYFTIADIALAIGLNRARGLDFDMALPAPLCRWHAAQKQRPGFVYATKGEPDMPGHRRAVA